MCWLDLQCALVRKSVTTLFTRKLHRGPSSISQHSHVTDRWKSCLPFVLVSHNRLVFKEYNHHVIIHHITHYCISEIMLIPQNDCAALFLPVTRSHFCELISDYLSQVSFMPVKATASSRGWIPSLCRSPECCARQHDSRLHVSMSQMQSLLLIFLKV